MSEDTLEEIIAEMRAREDLDGGDMVDNFDIYNGEYGGWDALMLIKAYADRLDAAHKRERGDCAKLREAIDYLCERMADMDATFDPSEVECLRAAFAAPPRNCDVGTVEEQSERIYAYCKAHKDNDAECLYCPLFGQTGGYCELVWAQMPYDEEGGAM